MKAANLGSGQPAAILLAEESVGDDRCKEIEDVQAQWKSFGLAPVVLKTKANGTPAQCGKERASLGPETAHQLGLKDAAWWLVLIDDSGTVRILQSARQNGLGELVKLGTDWENGRRIFSLQCGHCHGEDGTSTDYAGIKSLVRVSTRFSDDEIIRRGEATGGLELQNRPASYLRSLLAFLRGM